MCSALRSLNAKYGEVVYLDVLGQSMVVLGTHEAAVELFEKRSANYSDRPRSTMACLGWNWALPVIPYGPWWRRNRRTFHEFFNPGVVPQYQPIHLQAARSFVLRLLNDPENYRDHVRYAFGSTIMRISYGIDVDKESTPYLAIAEEAVAIFSDAFVPGKYLVEVFPILRFVPSWFPGAEFKRKCMAWTRVVNRLRNAPWEASVRAMKEGTAPHSLVTACMERTSNPTQTCAPADEEEIIKNTAASAYAGGSDTTSATILTFFLAMVCHPEVQKKAQAELDAVVGPHRLPDFDDQDSLPYVAAIIKECVRWGAVVPLGLVHRSLEDDEYRGYLIPGGTNVVPNAWAYTRDPRHYPNPEDFIPERYLRDGKLNPKVQDPGDIVFGYGRRVCPGRHFAEAALFAIVSSVLHTLDLSPGRDKDGKPIPIEEKMTDGPLLSFPVPFACEFRPRSSEVAALVHAANEQ
ncbi:cytochrome P450 [Trametes cingulata]|nr:cytochrome P450 [Trametes cingulata]